MLILYTTQCCSTASGVITTALYCKHWSYSTGEQAYTHVYKNERFWFSSSMSFFVNLGNLPLMCLWFSTLRSGQNHPWSYRVVHTSITIYFLFELFKLTWQYNRVSIQVVWSYLLSVYHYAFNSLLNKYAYYTSTTITYINVLCQDSQILLNKVFSIFAQCLFTDAPFHRINYWILTENSQQ